MFVLASSSERRINILKKLGIDFVQVAHKLNEQKVFKSSKKYEDYGKLVEKVALQKAFSIKDKYRNCVIISADTIVVLDDTVIGKPRNVFHAMEILRKLRNTKHKVYTGLVLVYTDDRKMFVTKGYSCSTVFTRTLTEDEIKEFAKKHLDKAGAYAVQEENDKFVKRIIGDYYNVVGFPVYLFLKLLAELILKFYKNMQQN